VLPGLSADYFLVSNYATDLGQKHRLGNRQTRIQATELGTEHNYPGISQLCCPRFLGSEADSAVAKVTSGRLIRNLESTQHFVNF
jgi:hypothetical protein